MADIFSKEKRSDIMSRIRGKDTKPELALRKLLSSSLFPLGYRYRLHYKKVPGRPDIAFTSQKVAVFMHGCFWHRCPKCFPEKIPVGNREYWTEKFRRNQERDARKEKELRAAGWKVVTVWECDLRKSPQRELSRVASMLRRRSASKGSDRGAR